MLKNWVGKHFLNQVRAGRRLAHAWFLEIAFVRDVSMHVCVCVCARSYELLVA